MDAVLDRRAGVLLGSAVGDALGAGYEFSDPMPDDAPIEMIGGGPFGFAPGQWTDDTSMAIAIAEAVAEGLDPTSPEFEDRVAARWLEWAEGKPRGMGKQTRAVLTAAQAPTGEALRDASLARYAAHPDRSAGNGALMRTAPLALARLTDWGYVTVAESIGELTHADPVSNEACAIWTYGIQHAVIHGTFDGVRAALESLPQHRADWWSERLDEAESSPPTEFPNNGWVVHALQAAWSAIMGTPIPDDNPSAHLRLALERAVRAGHDTDTVACIAGGLLGARWGAGAIPNEWVTMLHGWPGYTAADLLRLSRRDPLSQKLTRPVR